jgi:hypothetical protein
VGRFFSVALILCIAGLGAGVARAQSELVVKIDDRASGPAIPDDFAGLSFESSNLLADKNGSYRFSGSNKDLIQLFRTIGMSSGPSWTCQNGRTTVKVPATSAVVLKLALR